MKRIISIIAALAVVLTILSCCTGCGDEPKNTASPDEPTAVSFVMSVHRNFPVPVLTSQAVQQPLYDACYSYGDVSVYSVEGTPRAMGDYEINKPDASITKTKRKQLARQSVNSIMYDCSMMKAQTEEVDTLTAIKLSANDLQSSECTKREMLVYDSGLCSTGIISQVENDVLSADPQLVVEKLSQTHSLPDLENISVKWIGLGCVSGEQAKVPDSYKYKLEQLWSAIIEGSGGTVDFDPQEVFGDEPQDAPNVTNISFPQDSLDIDFTKKEVLDEPIKLETLKFVADSSEFYDKAEANETLKPVAELLLKYPELNIVIAGTTASAGDGYELSRQRASACKEALIKLGATDSQIKCIGLGSSDNCFHVNDLDENGNLIEKYAKMNRAIYIFSADSDTAKSFEDLL